MGITNVIIVNVWLMVTAARGRWAALPEKPRDGHELALVGGLCRYSTACAVWMTGFFIAYPLVLVYRCSSEVYLRGRSWRAVIIQTNTAAYR